MASKKSSIKKQLISLFSSLGILLLFVVSFLIFFQLRIVKGTGMYPAVCDGDLTLCYKTDGFVKNDVVWYQVDNTSYLGRVVAKGGDFVNITKDGDLVVNGTVQTGEIAFPTFCETWEEGITVPNGAYFILGDFRTETKDSRDFGIITEKQIQSKVICVIRHRKI